MVVSSPFFIWMGRKEGSNMGKKHGRDVLVDVGSLLGSVPHRNGSFVISANWF